LPVVSTRVGAEGLPTEDGENILLADSPGEFKAAVVKVLQLPALRKRLGSAGRRLYETEFTWSAVWRILEERVRL